MDRRRARMRRTLRTPRLRALRGRSCRRPARKPPIQLIRGDCLIAMATMAEKSIDLVAVDPPYGATDNHWDKPPPLEKWWEQIERVTTDEAVIAIFCQQPFTTQLIQSRRLIWRYELIWHKSRPTGFLWSRNRPLRAHEHIQVFCRRPLASVYHPQMTPGRPYKSKAGEHRQSTNWGRYRRVDRVSAGPRFPRSVLSFATVSQGKHPTQKPEELLEWIIRSYSNPGHRVLDCYMGSGTTGVACAKLGRRFVGVERDLKYFELAARRIGEAELAAASQALLAGKIA